MGDEEPAGAPTPARDERVPASLESSLGLHAQPAGSPTPARGKVRCDACGKEVGAASTYQRVGFTSGSRVNRVCGACFRGKLSRDEKLRFRKAAGGRKKAMEPEAPERRPDAPTPPDELRFGR